MEQSCKLITSLRLSFLHYKIITRIPVRITRRLYEMRYVEVARSHLLWKTKYLPRHWRESKTNSKEQSYTFCLYPLVQQGKWEGGVVFSKQGYQLGFSIFLIIINWWSCFQYTWPPLLGTQSPNTPGTAYQQKISSELIFREDTVSIIPLLGPVNSSLLSGDITGK